jgi:Methyltransferase FkbM domain
LSVVVEESAPLHTYIGTAEIEISRYIHELVEPRTLCLDIGGHDGLDALALARLSGTDVVSFEFADDRVVAIKRNLALNPAFGEHVTLVKTYVAFERLASPKTDTLDELVDVHCVGRVPQFVKIDVEGAEMSVLAGAPNVIASRPHLLIETHSAQLESECLALLQAAGYSPVTVDQRRWLRENRGNQHNRWIVARGRSNGAPGVAER